MLAKYPDRVIVSGKWAECFYYQFPPYEHRKRHKKKERRYYFHTDEEILSRRDDSLTRSRSMIRRLVNSNPELSKFITLTFGDNVIDLNVANTSFKTFIQRLKYSVEDYLKYIAVVEFQKRGAVHYHMLSNLRYIKKEDLASVWSNGFIKINRIDHVSNVGAYVSKYLQKDFADPRLVGRKAYFTSRIIKRPQVFGVNFQAVIPDVIRELGIDQLEPIFERSFESQYMGKTTYQQFKLDFVASG